MATCQGQHPDGSPCRNPAPEGKDYCSIHRRPDPSARLCREDVLAAIEERGGPEGLDLSHENLPGIDLSRAEPERELELLSRAMTQYWPRLSGVNFQGASLLEAKLQRADLRFADLRDADLYCAELQGADLQLARLQRVDLSAARDITGVRWYEAVLDKTRLRWEQLGEQGAKGIKVKIGDELVAERGEGTYDEAREAYLGLKNNFNELGRYDDASWAYRKERRMERAMSSWRRAAREYAEEKKWLEGKYGCPGWSWFYVRHGWKWWWDSVAQKLTDYGESPGWVLFWAALLLLVAYPLIYYVAGACFGPCCDPWAFAVAFALDYPDNLLLSLGSFSTLEVWKQGSLNTATRLWAASEAMAGISLLALLMFTLGNRISRS